jgi:hypothetical protein
MSAQHIKNGKKDEFKNKQTYSQKYQSKVLVSKQSLWDLEIDNEKSLSNQDISRLQYELARRWEASTAKANQFHILKSFLEKKKIYDREQQKNKNVIIEENSKFENIEDEIKISESVKQNFKTDDQSDVFLEKDEILFKDDIDEYKESVYYDLKSSKRKNPVFEEDLELPKISRYGKNTKVKKVTKTKSFFADHLLAFIAGFLFVTTLAGYFFFLQPLILEDYNIRATKQITDIETAFSLQIKSFQETQVSLNQVFNYDSTKVCDETPLYTNVNSDSEKMKRLEVGLFPKKNLQKLDNSAVFYSQEIKSIYNQTYTNYTESLFILNSSYKQISGYPAFLEYRNTWVETCKKLQTTRNTNANVVSSCQSLILATDNFRLKNEFNSLNEDLKTRIASGYDKCKTLTSGNTINNALLNSWFVDYDLFMNYTPNWQQTNENLQSTVQNFQTNLSRNKLILININKKSEGFFGRFYLLNFQI